MKTYKEWRELGLCVKRGQKSTSWNKEGVALFSAQQVARVPSFVLPSCLPTFEVDLELEIRRQMANFGFFPSDMDLWLEENEIVSRYPDAPEFEDHWMNIREY